MTGMSILIGVNESVKVPNPLYFELSAKTCVANLKNQGIGHYGGGRYGGRRYGGRRYGGGHYGGNLPKGGHYGSKERVTHISEIFELFFHKIRYTAI